MAVALAALISACRAAEAPGTEEGELLRATLPLAGATLVEHQVRLAAAAGAEPIVILVERLPATLTAAVDRLRQDGLRVDIARGLADAVDRIHPDEALLLIADGCVAGSDLVARVATSGAPAILTVPDDAENIRFERIDATARWGGLLLIDGARLRRTAETLGEWDLESTLLRRAVQEDAARIDAFEAGDAALLIADHPGQIEALDRSLIATARPAPPDWPGRYLFPPLVDLAALPLLRRGVAPRWIGAAAAAAALLALPFALFSWRWTALALLLLSGPLAAAAGRIADIRLTANHRPGGLHATRAAAASAALLLLAADLSATQGWGCWLLALIALAAMGALARERRIPGGDDPCIWLASVDGMIWLLAVAALGGSWLGAIGVAAAYAAGSFAFVQDRIIRRVAAKRV